MIETRAYQDRYVEQAREAILGGVRRFILAKPTGSGKTVTACKIIELTVANGRKALFLAPARELVGQTSRKLTEFGVDHGLLMAGRGHNLGAPCQVGCTPTLLSRVLRLKSMRPPPADLVFLDECLTGDTRLITNLGEITLSDAWKASSVLSQEEGVPCWKKIVAWKHQGRRSILTVLTASGKSVRCTANHPLMTRRGWVAAGDLLTTDQILSLGASGTGGSDGLRSNGLKSTKTSCGPCRPAPVVVGGRSSRSVSRSNSSSKGVGAGITPVESLATTGGQRRGGLNCVTPSDRRFWGPFSGTRQSSCRTAERPRSLGSRPTTGRDKGSGPSTSASTCTGSSRSYGLTPTAGMVSGQCQRAPRHCLAFSGSPICAGGTGGNASAGRGWIRSATSGSPGGFATTGRLLGTACSSTPKGTARRRTRSLPPGSTTTSPGPVSRKMARAIGSYTFGPTRRGCSTKGCCRTSPAAWSTNYDPVISIVRSEAEDVFDIEVEDTHCFFGNGLLTHNCRLQGNATRELLKYYPNAVLIGLDATPVRGDGRGLGGLCGFEKIIQCVTRAHLIEMGYIVRTKVYGPYRPDMSRTPEEIRANVRTTDHNGDWTPAFRAGRMDRPELIGDVVQQWKRLGENRPSIFFASNVSHSVHTCAAFNVAGIPARHMDASTPDQERRELLGDENGPGLVERGLVKVLTSYGVLVSGIDLPCVGTIIMGRPTKSLSVYFQSLGRGVRPYRGTYEKGYCILLDHAGNWERHGLPDQEIEWELSPDKKIEDLVKEKEPTQPRPVTCPNCYAVFSAQPSCPECGHVMKKQRKVRDVAENKDGVLVEVAQDTPMGEALRLEKLRRVWQRCLAVSAARDGTASVALALFKKDTGLLPWDVPGLPNVPVGSDQWKRPVRELYPGYWRGAT